MKSSSFKQSVGTRSHELYSKDKSEQARTMSKADRKSLSKTLVNMSKRIIARRPIYDQTSRSNILLRKAKQMFMERAKLDALIKERHKLNSSGITYQYQHKSGFHGKSKRTTVTCEDMEVDSLLEADSSTRTARRRRSRPPAVPCSTGSTDSTDSTDIIFIDSNLTFGNTRSTSNVITEDTSNDSDDITFVDYKPACTKKSTNFKIKNKGNIKPTAAKKNTEPLHKAVSTDISDSVSRHLSTTPQIKVSKTSTSVDDTSNNSDDVTFIDFQPALARKKPSKNVCDKPCKNSVPAVARSILCDEDSNNSDDITFVGSKPAPAKLSPKKVASKEAKSKRIALVDSSQKLDVLTVTDTEHPPNKSDKSELSTDNMSSANSESVTKDPVVSETSTENADKSMELNSQSDITKLNPSVDITNISNNVTPDNCDSNISKSVTTSEGNENISSNTSEPTDSTSLEKTKTVECPYCNVHFSEDIIIHHKSLHFRERFFSCIDCEKNFHTLVGLENHRCTAT